MWSNPEPEVQDITMVDPITGVQDITTAESEVEDFTTKEAEVQDLTIIDPEAEVQYLTTTKEEVQDLIIADPEVHLTIIDIEVHLTTVGPEAQDIPKIGTEDLLLLEPEAEVQDPTIAETKVMVTLN